MNKPIPDDTKNQIWTIADALEGRFCREIDLSLMAREIRLNLQNPEFFTVPGL